MTITTTTNHTCKFGQLSDKELDCYIVQSSKQGKSIRKTAKELGVSHNTVRNRIEIRKLDVNVKPTNNWKQIVQYIMDKHIPFYQSEGLYPIELRQEYYRLIADGILAKSNSNYTKLSSVTSEARR
jgi:predicted transcriptional regulator